MQTARLVLQRRRSRESWEGYHKVLAAILQLVVISLCSHIYTVMIYI